MGREKANSPKHSSDLRESFLYPKDSKSTVVVVSQSTIPKVHAHCPNSIMSRLGVKF